MSESKAEGKKEGAGGPKDFNILSLILSLSVPGLAGVHNLSFPLKIKFLDKLYNAYFSAQFQTKIPYYEKKLSLFCGLADGLLLYTYS